jgi:hypothetical protein
MTIPLLPHSPGNCTSKEKFLESVEKSQGKKIGCKNIAG